MTSIMATGVMCVIGKLWVLFFMLLNTDADDTAWITVLKACLMQYNVESGVSRGAVFDLEGCLGQFESVDT